SPSDDIWADSWVIQPGANGSGHEQIQWSVAEQAEDDDVDPPAVSAFELAEPFDEPEPDEALDVTFEDLAGSANGAFDPDDAEPQAHRIEDAALEDIFVQGDAFETDAWMPPGDAPHTARDDDHVDLPERWMFQSRRGV